MVKQEVHSQKGRLKKIRKFIGYFLYTLYMHVQWDKEHRRDENASIQRGSEHHI